MELTTEKITLVIDLLKKYLKNIDSESYEILCNNYKPDKHLFIEDNPEFIKYTGEFQFIIDNGKNGEDSVFLDITPFYIQKWKPTNDSEIQMVAPFYKLYDKCNQEENGDWEYTIEYIKKEIERK